MRTFSFLFLSLFFKTTKSEILTQDCDCGVEKADRRIVGGDMVIEFTKKWPCFLMTEDHQFFCTGSIISDRHVITAGHCTEGLNADDIKVVLLTLRKNDTKPENIYDVVSVTRNPYYERSILSYDLSILQLAKPLNLMVMTPVCLPPFEMRSYISFLALGWGRKQELVDSDELREVELKATDFKPCNNFWKGKLIEVIHLCAGQIGKDTCQGDSGGPLMERSNGRWRLAGTTSFGDSCAKNDYAVYTRVSYFVPWILNVIEKQNGMICKR